MSPFAAGAVCKLLATDMERMDGNDVHPHSEPEIARSSKDRRGLVER
jgi:hypothetical protein